MNKRLPWLPMGWACACLTLAACQLNDTDSAPRAPDLGGALETDNSSATAPAGSGSNAPEDETAAPEESTTPPPNVLTQDASLAPGFDAGFPQLPTLEAGTLMPGSFSPPDSGLEPFDSGLSLADVGPFLGS